MIAEFFCGLVEVVTEVFKPVVELCVAGIGAVAKLGAYVSEKTANFIQLVDPNCGGICKTLEDASEFLNEVGDALLGIGRNLNIVELNDCSSEELGAKTLLPDTRDRNTEETACHYIDYLSTVELNKEEFNNWEPEKKFLVVQ